MGAPVSSDHTSQGRRTDAAARGMPTKQESSKSPWSIGEYKWQAWRGARNHPGTARTSANKNLNVGDIVNAPNAPAQARRADDVRLLTKTRSRRCLQPAGSAISSQFSFSKNSRSFSSRFDAACLRNSGIMSSTHFLGFLGLGAG